MGGRFGVVWRVELCDAERTCGVFTEVHGTRPSIRLRVRSRMGVILKRMSRSLHISPGICAQEKSATARMPSPGRRGDRYPFICAHGPKLATRLRRATTSHKSLLTFHWKRRLAQTSYSRAAPRPLYPGGVGRGCGVGRSLGNGVGLGVAVGVGVGVTAGVGVGVTAGVGVGVTVGVAVGVGVGVG
jgi:hypothetical protein